MVPSGGDGPLPEDSSPSFFAGTRSYCSGDPGVDYLFGGSDGVAPGAGVVVAAAEVARILVSPASAKATSEEELYDLLSSEIQSPKDREAFRRKGPSARRRP